MQKITYHYSALSKQTWFYSGILYLALLSAVYILVVAYRTDRIDAAGLHYGGQGGRAMRQAYTALLPGRSARPSTQQLQCV